MTSAFPRPDQAFLTASARSALLAARSSTPAPTLRPGTCKTPGDPAMIVLDGDQAPSQGSTEGSPLLSGVAIPCEVLTPAPGTGDRVMVLLTPPAGAFVVGFIGDARDRWGGEGGTGPEGPPGPAGPQGPPGPQGDSGGFYAHTQATAAEVWTINHPLPYRPAVSVVDSAGEQVEGTVVYTGTSTVQVTFSAAFAGSAYLS